jgi:hypothetical protein
MAQAALRIPKVIAVDSDGHVGSPILCLTCSRRSIVKDSYWVRVGEHGKQLGQFSALDGVFIDKNSRMFTFVQYPRRVQMFRYITDAEAEQLKKEKEAQRGGVKSAEKAAVEKPMPLPEAAAKSDSPK